jgi:hypothetical protein
VGQGDDEEHQTGETFTEEQGVQSLMTRAEGWLANASRIVELWSDEKKYILKVDGIEFFITKNGKAIGKKRLSSGSSLFDKEVFLGPVIVFALAMRKVWSLHGSAATYNGRTIAFLAESGTGKSTLAAYLSRQADWSLVADDILPVTGDSNGLIAWPHFPQLKLPMGLQPAINSPEQLSLDILFELVLVDRDAVPDIKRLPPEKAVMVLLGHTAGARLFDGKMLESHLAFCSQAAEHVPVYQLSYPKSKDALPKIKEMLESLC